MGRRKKSEGATTSDSLLEGLRASPEVDAKAESVVTETVEQRVERETQNRIEKEMRRRTQHELDSKRAQIEKLIPAGARPAPMAMDGEVPVVFIDDDAICPICHSDDTSFVLEKHRFELFMTALFMGKAKPPAIAPKGPWTCFACGVAFMTPSSCKAHKDRLEREIADLSEKVKPTTPQFVSR